MYVKEYELVYSSEKEKSKQQLDIPEASLINL